MKVQPNHVCGATLLFSGLVGAVLAVAPAGAQTAKPSTPPAKPASNEPQTQTTTAAYGDWVLRCQQTVAPAPPARTCEILQSVMVKAQSAPFAQIAFGKPTPADPLHVTVVVPINVSFPSSVRIAVDEKDQQPTELAWTRCVPAGCFATATPRDDLLKRWRALTNSGRVTFKSAGGQDVIMPISFRGLAQALDALAKER